MTMDGRIGRLNLRCKTLGAPQNAGALRARLERVAREQLAAEYEAAIGSALGDDPSVYVLRKVNARLSMALDPLTPDRSAARTWGQRAALAAVRTIARQPEGEGLVRFDDQADFVTHFISDLVHGTAWERWFYGAFGALRQLPTRDALVRVLEDNAAEIPAILARLHASGDIDPLLHALGPEGRGWLWSQARGDGALESAGARSLLNLALELFDRLDLWQGARPALEDLPADLLAGPLDWRDRQSLADGMLAAAQALLRRGHVRRDPSSLAARLPEALAPLDWLDGERLEQGLGVLFSGALLQPPARALFDLPVRPVPFAAGAGAPAARLTPRQQQLLETLRDLVAGVRVRIEAGEGDDATEALRLYSALVAHDAGWAGDGLALETIRRLVDGWRWLQQSGAPETHLRRIARGEVAAGSGAGELAALAAFGEPGAQVLRALLRERRSAGAETVLQTRCAGAALLLRVLLDARMTLLYRDTGFAAQRPGLDGLVLALLLALVGPAGTVDEDIDSGLLFLTGLITRPDGLEPIRTAAGLRERWRGAGAPDAWQALWLHLLDSQHLLQPQALLLYRLQHSGQDLLVAGDASGNLWPLVATEGERGAAMRWPETWQQVTGQAPQMITKALLEEAGEERTAIYHDGAQRLPAVLDTLAGHTSLDPAWDYSLALAANSILRLWARWLRGFSESSAQFLLDNFIHRPGTITHRAGRLFIALEPRPLDIILPMAGYLDPLQIPWMGVANLTFEIRGA